MRKTSLLILSLAGLFDSVYLLWVYTSPSHPLVCLGTGCDVVRASRYAELWGHSLPVYGVLMYLEGFVIHAWCAWCVGSAIIVTLFFVLTLKDFGPSQRAAWDLLETEQGRFELRKQFVLVAVLMVAGEGI